MHHINPYILKSSLPIHGPSERQEIYYSFAKLSCLTCSLIMITKLNTPANKISYQPELGYSLLDDMSGLDVLASATEIMQKYCILPCPITAQTNVPSNCSLCEKRLAKIPSTSLLAARSSCELRCEIRRSFYHILTQNPIS